MSRIPRLSAVEPLAGAAAPRVSVIFAARNEAEKLAPALASKLAQDYPNFEVIAVDDRSSDATPQILDEFARKHDRLKVVHVRELPQSWLGKPHALQTGYEQATGEWLLFTDADVQFAPDVLGRTLALAQRDALDHLTLFAQLDMSGFWETTGTLYFSVGFAFGVEPWRVPNPKSRRYMGAGYFQLLRRSVYEAIGTHRRLAMEVVDDMKLGKLVKLGGFRSGVAMANSLVRLRWNQGARELIHNVTKNFFAASGFSVTRTLIQIAGVLAVSVVPFVALATTSGLAFVFAAIASAIAVAFLTEGARRSGISWLYGFTHPLGGLLFCYMLLRSMAFTLWRGGVVWRDTFYPLEQLKRGLV
jgi:glycosyltransferase involved in cell wall biosynthesis